ncbi:meiosis-specific protein Hop1p [Monosporozyma unispora]|nr:DNA binding protein [Kazachstania unispora]
MSTNQLFLTKQTNKKVVTQTKMAISSEQSQKLIQTMLTMSFGCLAFLRGLFPDEYFLDQRFVPEKNDKNSDKQTSSIKIKTLIKGKSKEIDLLLNWLEKGVFQSIKLKYLKALSLGIFTDESNPTNLCENYTFTFDYNEKDNVSMSIETQDLSKKANKSLNDEVITIKDSRKMVQQLMRRFIIITQSLEPLPDEKFLSMKLLFNDNVDPKYQPPLFKDATFEPRATIKIPRDVESDSFDVGKLNTGYHQCQLAVLSTCQNMTKNQDEDFEMEDYQEVDPLQQIIDLELPDKENNPIETISLLTQNESNLHKHNVKLPQSQTANILGEFLNSSQPSILPTQLEANLNKVSKKSFVPGQQLKCECNTSFEDNAGVTRFCITCNRMLHGLCYGNTKNGKFECFTCVYEADSKIKLNTNTSLFHKFMVLRKTYRAINKLLGDPPESFSQYMSRVFTKEECKIAKNIEDFVFSLNCLFYDNTFHLTTGTEVASKYNIFSEMIVNIPGVKTREQISLNLAVKYPITIQIGNRAGNLSYLKVLPKSKEEIELWVEDFEKLERILTKHPLDLDNTKNNPISEGNIINLSSLAINDTETQDPVQICQKRKRLDLEDYLNTKESSIIPETLAMTELSETKNHNQLKKRKIRKISVSKGMVKSAW